MPSEQTKRNLSGETGRPSNPEDPAMPHSPEFPAGPAAARSHLCGQGAAIRGLRGNRPLEETTHRPLPAPQLRPLPATADAPKQTRKPGLPLPSSQVPSLPGGLGAREGWRWGRMAEFSSLASVPSMQWGCCKN